MRCVLESCMIEFPFWVINKENGMNSHKRCHGWTTCHVCSGTMTSKFLFYHYRFNIIHLFWYCPSNRMSRTKKCTLKLWCLYNIQKKCWHYCISLATKSYNVHYGGEAWCLIPSLGCSDFLWENPFIQISSKCINQPPIWFVWFNTTENLIWKFNLRFIP
jgi:hypothetical protein